MGLARNSAPRWPRSPKTSRRVSKADRRRLSAVREQRAALAAAFFKANASQWERIRSLHAPEQDVEAAIVRQFELKPVDTLLDAGTGTGRMLELLAPLIRQGIGVDASPEMLAIARDRLQRAEARHCQVRLAIFTDCRLRTETPNTDSTPHCFTRFCTISTNRRRRSPKPRAC